MSKKDDLLFQSQSLKSSNTIIWNNNNINGNININNNYTGNINPIKRSGSITFKNASYNKNVLSSPIITPNSNHFKQIKLGANGSKSRPRPKNFSNNHFGIKTEGNDMEMSQAKNYINYLHEHLDTSYNANNELSNKTEMIINMTKGIESEIKRNNEIYKSLILSYNDKLKANNKYKNEFINFLNQYKKQFKSINSEIVNEKKQFNELSEKNSALKKEIKDTEDIISYLKKTEDILSNNALSKYREQLNQKEKKVKDEINTLNNELNKLEEIKNIGNNEIENLSKRNIKLKEDISKLENKKNNLSISDKKIRNKKYIIDKKYKKNNNDYYKQLTTAEKNKSKDLLKQIYDAIQNKIKQKKEEEKQQKLKEEKKPKIEKNEKKTKNSTSKNKVKVNKKKVEIEIEDDYESDEEEEEVKEKIVKIKKVRKQTEEQLTSTMKNKSKPKLLSQEIPMSQTFYNNKQKKNKAEKYESESENEENENEKEYDTEIEKESEAEKKKNKKKEKKVVIKEKKTKKKEEDEAIAKKKKEKSKADSNSKDKSITKTKKKENEKSISSKVSSKEKSKSKIKNKEKKKKKNESKENSKEKMNDLSKKEKEYEFSVLSDQSKKSKIFSHVNQNSLSMDELSSIMSANKTQKKLSQSQESILDILSAPLKGSYLYTITSKGKLLSFNITHKKFAIIDSNIIDGWTSFIPNYLKNIEGSLLLNTMEGLFIITGAKHNDLYFYSQEKNLVADITTFKSCHKYGGLLLAPTPDNTLFAIGGKNENNEVERFSFDDDECKSMPNLLTKRINASYTFINCKLYAIFGEANNTIEYLNIKKLKNNWTKIDYKMSDDNLDKDKYINNIYGHVSLPVHDDILIVGGKNNKKMMVLDLDEKTLDVTDMKVPFIDVVGEYLFDKEKFFNKTINEEKKDKEGNEVNQLIGMDNSGNVHLFDYNFNYIVLLIKNHIKEK